MRMEEKKSFYIFFAIAATQKLFHVNTSLCLSHSLIYSFQIDRIAERKKMHKATLMYDRKKTRRKN